VPSSLDNKTALPSSVAGNSRPSDFRRVEVEAQFEPGNLVEYLQGWFRLEFDRFVR
jgi:hypothetical protein